MSFLLIPVILGVAIKFSDVVEKAGIYIMEKVEEIKNIPMDYAEYKKKNEANKKLYEYKILSSFIKEKYGL